MLNVEKIKKKLFPETITKPLTLEEIERSIRLNRSSSFIVGDVNLPELKPRAVTELDIQTDTAISSGMPQFLKPKVIPLPVIPLNSEYGLQDQIRDNLKELIDVMPLDGPPVIGQDADGNWAGTFQPSLKPSEIIKGTGFDQIVYIGNPNKGIFCNTIRNSRGEWVYFCDSYEIIQKAVDRFNLNYNENERQKTVLAGFNDELEAVNISLLFDSLHISVKGIHTNFEKWEFVSGHSNLAKDDAHGIIKATCQFYLKGEIVLDEMETRIEDMTILGLNYINKHRMRSGERFVYVS